MFKCSTCGIDVTAKKNFTHFVCPGCLKAEIIRCSTCKTGSNKYVCNECGFVGP